jgi:hypothetical protein
MQSIELDDHAGQADHLLGHVPVLDDQRNVAHAVLQPRKL